MTKEVFYNKNIEECTELKNQSPNDKEYHRLSQ